MFAQDLNKKISIKMKDKSIAEIISSISDLGNVKFSYSTQQVPANKKISVKAKNKTIKEILNEVLKENGIDYFVIENQIILKPQKNSNNENPVVKEIQKYTISGYLKDKLTGEILIGATVYANGTSLGTVSNPYGFYSLTLPKDTYNLVFSFIGYENQTQPFILNENKKISIEFESSKLKMKEVEIISNENKSEVELQNQLSEFKLTPKLLSQLTGFVGEIDIIKSLQAIPGIKSYGDGSTLFYVRGGNSDQNLILIDEVPIYNPSHLFGFFTAIAPDAIKDVEAYKGDFPANFGGRLSSVIDIRTKDGNMKKLGFSGSLGPFTSNLTFEGPIKKDKCSFFLSGRRSNLNWLKLSKTPTKSFAINFYDINAKLNFNFNNKNRLFVSFYTGNDEFSRVSASTAKSFGISWKNNLGTLRWNHIFNDKIFSNTTINFSRYNYYLYLSREQDDYWNSAISNSTIKSDFTFFYNPKNTFKFGVEFTKHLSNPGNVNFSDNNIMTNVPQIPKYTSNEFDFYLSNDQVLTKRLSVRYGLRVPVWQNIGPTTVYYFNTLNQVMDTIQIGEKDSYSTFISLEPRINAKYIINKKTSLKASYNRTTQFVQVLSNSTSPFTSLEVWVPSGPNIQPQKADQFALGCVRDFLNSKLIFSTELFYKLFHNQIDYKDHANMLFNPLIEGELRFGEARSYGAEFMLRKPAGKFTGWLGYTYSRAIKQIEGINNSESFPAFYDRPHDVCVNISYNNMRHWTISANWIFLSGGAITTPTGFYYYNGYSVPIYGAKNNSRLPNYHRLDLSITYNINKPSRKYQHSFSFSLYNAYGRKNPISANFNKVVDDNGNFVVPSDINGQYDLVPTTISVAGTIPSLTYNFKF